MHFLASEWNVLEDSAIFSLTDSEDFGSYNVPSTKTSHVAATTFPPPRADRAPGAARPLPAHWPDTPACGPGPEPAPRQHQRAPLPPHPAGGRGIVWEGRNAHADEVALSEGPV